MKVACDLSITNQIVLLHGVADMNVSSEALLEVVLSVEISASTRLLIEISPNRSILLVSQLQAL